MVASGTGDAGVDAVVRVDQRALKVHALRDEVKARRAEQPGITVLQHRERHDLSAGDGRGEPVVRHPGREAGRRKWRRRATGNFDSLLGGLRHGELKSKTHALLIVAMHKIAMLGKQPHVI